MSAAPARLPNPSGGGIPPLGDGARWRGGRRSRRQFTTLLPEQLSHNIGKDTA